ncbi:MAG: HDIG domain-containing protein [Treponema sp.]|nr:HDIG domain-containing protein [Treponema sp.]
MKAKNVNKGEKNSIKANIFAILGDYIKKHYQYLLLFLISFLAVSALNFVKVSTTETVANYSLDEFEIGQIADRTIISSKTILPDDVDTVSIQAGEKIIKKGFPITEDGYAKLKKMAASPTYIDYRAFADSELFLFLLGILWYTLFSFLPFKRKLQIKEPIFQVICFLLVYSVTAFFRKLGVFSDPYSVCIIIPSALCIMLTTILFGQTSAVILSLIMSLGVLCATEWELVPFLFTLAATFCAHGIVRKIDNRLDLIFAAIMLSVSNFVFILILTVIFNDTFTDMGKIFGGVIANGFLSGAMALGFLTPLEYMLNTASVFRLMDLSDTNSPIFKQMQIQANGTYNHSIMVSQLAESACREIGANALLARVGGYYHDIGKIDQSEYFVENQFDHENKHDELNPTLSASIIKSHVKKGVEKAHQMHLPQDVIDIISEHHGNSVISYFYKEGKEKDPTLMPEDFSYPGNPPTSKESAVVMLADTVEAACKTLDNPTSIRLEKFITVLINQKVENKQLDNCDLTFRDISKIKESFVHLLTGFYHNRIKYQNQQDPEKENKEAKDSKEAKESKEK